MARRACPRDGNETPCTCAMGNLCALQGPPTTGEERVRDLEVGR